MRLAVEASSTGQAEKEKSEREPRIRRQQDRKAYSERQRVCMRVFVC